MTNTNTNNTTTKPTAPTKGSQDAPKAASATKVAKTSKGTPKGKTARKAATTKAAKPAAKKTAKATAKPTANKAKDAAAAIPREFSKKQIVLDLLRRKNGATMAEIAKATDWQNHSIRGFISGNLTKKMGLVVESSKNEAGDRTYRIASK